MKPLTQKIENRLDSIERRLTVIERKLGTVDKSTIARTKSSGGKAETSIILRKLDENILNTDYFKNPRSTGDVRAELKKRTALSFTPRKVSQALGVLHKKGRLDRIGPKGRYQYIHRT